MGLFISLTINPDHIEPAQWAAAYDDSLRVLENFPVPLMRYTNEERLGEKRLLYTSTIIQNKGAENEYWQICGDMVSLREAESFRLYRDLNNWVRSREQTWTDRDVLWADEENIRYVDGYGINIFGNKTQGYPYHLALLAVAVLFESRFPERVFLLGDITREQIETMMAWLNNDLNMPVSTPVCIDGERLYHRLAALYDTPKLAIERFKTLSREAKDVQFQQLLTYAPKRAVIDDFKRNLDIYHSLHQFGAIDLISQFLTATQNLKQLIEMVLEIGRAKEKKDKFNLEALLKRLSESFVTFDYPERRLLSLPARSREKLMTIEDVLSQTFMRMGGIPSSIEFYLDAESLLDLFAAYEPAKKDRFRQVIAEGEQNCRDTLKQIEELLAKMPGEPEAQEEKNVTEAETVSVLSPQSHPLSPETQYILDQVARQRQTFKGTEETAKHFGGELQQIIQQTPERFSETEQNYYLENIYRVTYENRIPLQENAWQMIDQEENVDILKAILALSHISNQEISFWRWRIYILEHQSLWHYLTPE